MIVVTQHGVRLVRDSDDWRLLNTLILGIANAVAETRGDLDRMGGFCEGMSAGALSYLRELDPPQGPDDAVVWAWTDEPVASRHVPIPRVEVARSLPPVRGADGRWHRADQVA